MDAFNLLVGILLVFLAFQMQQTWIVFVIIAVLLITMRSLVSSIILIAVAVFLFMSSSGSLKEYFLPILIILIAVAVLSSLKKKPQAQDPYGLGMGGQDMYGGLEGLGGEGGMGGY